MKISILGQCRGSEKGWMNGSASRKTRSDRSDKKRIHEFSAEIQAMIDNDLNKAIRSIAMDMGMSELLIRQVVHKDIFYFS